MSSVEYFLAVNLVLLTSVVFAKVALDLCTEF